MSLQVKSGPLVGEYNNLIEYLEAEENLQANCEHRETRRAEVVSGLESEKCHYTVATVCRHCRKTLDYVRQRITHSQGRRVAVEIGQR